MTIEKIFENSGSIIKKVDCFNDAFFGSLPEDILRYLKCMGTTVRLHETVHGSAYTTLFSIYDIKHEQDIICSENGLLIIGNGLNGDLLTINLSNRRVGYVFHDELWEDNFEVFEDIYIELPFEIDTFLNMAIEGTNYPYDGYTADNFM